jgi:hypothetical protein
MLSDTAIKVEKLGKCYQIYDRPRDRLFQILARGRKQYYREFWALNDVSLEVKKVKALVLSGGMVQANPRCCNSFVVRLTLLQAASRLLDALRPYWSWDLVLTWSLPDVKTLT